MRTDGEKTSEPDLKTPPERLAGGLKGLGEVDSTESGVLEKTVPGGQKVRVSKTLDYQENLEDLKRPNK